MAHVFRHPKSRYFSAYFRDSSGKLRCRSTKLTDRAKALKVADAWEKVFRSQNALEHIRETFKQLAREIDPASVTVPTVKEYFEMWREQHKDELSERTFVSYDQRLRQFADHVGDGLSVDGVKKTHARAFRAKIKKATSASTANHAVKVLRAVFNAAMTDGLIAGNPFALDKVHEKKNTKRQAFTVQQVERLVRVADQEWKSLIIFGIFTGQRLGDLVRLTWSQIDFDRKEILFTTEKTGRPLAIPASDALWAHILTLQRGTPTANVHPRAYEVREKVGIGGVSKDFMRLLVKAGICEARPNNKKREREGDVSREVSPFTFHSLRHSVASWLRDVGTSESIAMEIVGHSSVSVDRIYVHANPKLMRDALNKLPKIG